jgi:DNA polymerase III epsilon subunit family exonuclease
MSVHPKITVLDFETTGLHRPRATQLALVELDENLEIADEYQATINPEQVVDEFVLNLTHLTQGELDASPKFADIWGKVFPKIDGRVIVAHNAPFDMRVLENEYKAMRLKGSPRNHICTSRSARKIAPGIKNYTLPTLIEHFGIRNSLAHSAPGDARATYELLLKLKAIDPKFPSAADVRERKLSSFDQFDKTVGYRREAIAQVEHDLLEFDEACDHYEAALNRGYVRLIITGNPRIGKTEMRSSLGAIGLKYIESPAVSDLVFVIKCEKAPGGSKINRGVELGIPIISESTAYALIERYAN